MAVFGKFCNGSGAVLATLEKACEHYSQLILFSASLALQLMAPKIETALLDVFQGFPLQSSVSAHQIQPDTVLLYSHLCLLGSQN